MSISTREDQQHASKFASVLRDDGGSTSAAPPRRRRRIPRWLVILGVLGVVAAVLALTVGSSLMSPATVTGRFLSEKAQRSDLVVSITEDGTLEKCA